MSAHPTEQRMPRLTRRGLAALVSTLAIAGSLALAPAAVAAPPAATLDLDVTATATTGGTVTVTVTADAVSDLYAYDLELTVPAALVAEIESAAGPDGGFTSATTETAAGPTAGIVTVTHTRLGTSPGLGSAPATPTAPITLATVTLRAQTAGVAEIALSSARLVSTTGDVVTIVDAASASTTITAPPLPDPGTTTPPATGGTTPGAGTGTTPGASGQVAGDLAATGATPIPWLIAGAVGVVLIAAGALVVIRRRQAVSE